MEVKKIQIVSHKSVNDFLNEYRIQVIYTTLHFIMLSKHLVVAGLLQTSPI